MLNRIFGILKGLYFRLLSPSGRSKYLKNKVHHMGDNVLLYTTRIGTEPYLLDIHDNVSVAADVSFITHDISVMNVSRYLGLNDDEQLDKVGPIVLYDNCYIGANALLMPSTSVGRNSIVAAGSIVTKPIPDNEVWGGIPAKFIMTIDEYAARLQSVNATYPWITDGKFNVPQYSRELADIRERFFFDRK